MTVYLIQEPTSDKNLTSAKAYGKIISIISSEAKPSKEVTKTIDTIAKSLEDFDSDKDYLCWAGGDPLVLLLTGAVAMNLGITELKYLLWNREIDAEGKRNSKEGFYVSKTISLLEGTYQ